MCRDYCYCHAPFTYSVWQKGYFHLFPLTVGIWNLLISLLSYSFTEYWNTKYMFLSSDFQQFGFGMVGHSYSCGFYHSKSNHWKSKQNCCHFVWISNGFGQNGPNFIQNGTPLENRKTLENRTEGYPPLYLLNILQLKYKQICLLLTSFNSH